MSAPDDERREKLIAMSLLGILLIVCGAVFNLAITLGPFLSSPFTWQLPRFNLQLLVPVLVIGNASLLLGAAALYIGICNFFANRSVLRDWYERIRRKGSSPQNSDR